MHNTIAIGLRERKESSIIKASHGSMKGTTAELLQYMHLTEK